MPQDGTQIDNEHTAGQQEDLTNAHADTTDAHAHTIAERATPVYPCRVARHGRGGPATGRDATS
jgi:hypothetical protein